MNRSAYSYQPRTYAAQNPSALAFRICATGESVTFCELESRANQGAQALRSLGLRTGDHIALVMENRREFLEICFAADRAGLYYTTISTHLTRDEIAYIVKDCEAKALIFSDRFAGLLQTLPGVGDDRFRLFVVGEASSWAESWPDLMARMPSVPIEDEAQGLDMLYSSGTTGRPKGVLWPLPGDRPGGRTMLIDLLTSLFGYDSSTRYLCPAPLYHAAPLRHTMVTIRMGGCAFIMDRFEADEALRLIESEKITHSQWVPTMFVRLLRLPVEQRRRYDLSSLRMVIHAAAPCPPDIKRQMIEWWGPIIHEYYAGTENNGFTAITSEEWLEHPGSVGRAKLGVIHVCDENGVELPAGAEGEIYFENGHRFSYHNDPEKTASCTNAKGWTTLGDIGRLDDEGYLYLTDRKSFMIISGGVNIYPQETEDVLLSHPAVLDVAVIGVPNIEFGEEVKAIVQLVTPSSASPELEKELISFCRMSLSPIKCPRTIDFRAALPRSATGKLYKRLLRDEFRSGRS